MFGRANDDDHSTDIPVIHNNKQQMWIDIVCKSAKSFTWNAEECTLPSFEIKRGFGEYAV